MRDQEGMVIRIYLAADYFAFLLYYTRVNRFVSDNKINIRIV
jgi:hypothetical protein